jgi:hypothetical protein
LLIDKNPVRAITALKRSSPRMLLMIDEEAFLGIFRVSHRLQFAFFASFLLTFFAFNFNSNIFAAY